jgi:hypothetical protein
VFQLNQSFLESLLIAANSYDFAILILTPDDLLKSRGKQYKTARDNVVFEHGLFLGRLGPRRAFILCEENVKILSDFSGITVSKFKKSTNDIKTAVEPACNQIQDTINENLNVAELGFYPSTALAIGYFENFVSKIFTELLQNLYIIKINGKEQPDLRFKSFTFTIIIPESLDFLEEQSLEATVHIKNLQQILVNTVTRDFPFYVKEDVREEFLKGNVLNLYDVPTTLLTSKKTINLILNKSFIGKTPNQTKLERREIRNFQLALESQLKEQFSDHFGTIIRFDTPKCLDGIVPVKLSPLAK